MPTMDYAIGRERYTFMDFTSMFGMSEMEAGVADIVNKAKDDGCLLADVHFGPSDLKSDTDAFHELRSYGWLKESHGSYRLAPATVARVHRRFPNI